MPKLEHSNITSIADPVVRQDTQKREPIAFTDSQAPTWRHPAEAALAEIAEDLGGGIEVMASLDGDLNITMEGSCRIEARDMCVNIVPLGRPLIDGDASETIRLSYDGLGALVRLLGAIQAWAAAEDATLPAVA
jgi:hypothetical protein